MRKRDTWTLGIAAATAATLLALLSILVAEVGRPYPGFFVAPDYRIFPAEPAALDAGLAWGDRIVAVDGRSPLTLARRVEAGAPIRYEVERGGRRLAADLAPRPYSWRIFLDHFGVFAAVSALMLIVGALVFLQNARARPNRYFLLYMCLWAVSNVAVPASQHSPTLGQCASSQTVCNACERINPLRRV